MPELPQIVQNQRRFVPTDSTVQNLEKIADGSRFEHRKMAAQRFLKTWVKKARILWSKIEPKASLIDANATTQRVNSFEIKKRLPNLRKQCQNRTRQIPKILSNFNILKRPLSSISSRRIPGCKGKRLYLRAVNYLSKYRETLLF